VTSLVCRALAGKCSGDDAIEIKYLKAPGVRNDPNLESIPEGTVFSTRALTPLIWEHVNPYGRFDLDMNTRLALL